MSRYELSKLNLEIILKHLPAPEFIEVLRRYPQVAGWETIGGLQVPKPSQSTLRIHAISSVDILNLYERTLKKEQEEELALTFAYWEDENLKIRLLPDRKTALRINYKGAEPAYVTNLKAELFNVQYSINARNIMTSQQIPLPLEHTAKEMQTN